jgi:hypothetical protein
MLATLKPSIHKVSIKNREKCGVILLPSRVKTQIKFVEVIELVKHCPYDKVAFINYNNDIYGINDILYQCETYPDELCFMKTDNFLSKDE